jgi:hypothetical protein
MPKLFIKTIKWDILIQKVICRPEKGLNEKGKTSPLRLHVLLLSLSNEFYKYVYDNGWRKLKYARIHLPKTVDKNYVLV